MFKVPTLPSKKKEDIFCHTLRKISLNEVNNTTEIGKLQIILLLVRIALSIKGSLLKLRVIFYIWFSQGLLEVLGLANAS